MRKKLLLFLGLILVTATTAYSQANYDNQKFTLGEEIGSLSELAEAKYMVIKGHAIDYYEGFSDETWVGNRYIATPEGYELEATASSLVKLIPSGEEDTYYVYWVNHGRYLALGSDHYNGKFGWQYSVDNLAAAVPVKFACVEGKFQMNHKGLYQGEHIDFYIATEPSAGTHSNLRFFSLDGKGAIESGYYYTDIVAMDYPLDFNFTINEVSVDEAVVDKILDNSIVDAVANLASSIETSRGYLESYRGMVIFDEDITAYEEAIAAAEQVLKDEAPLFTDVVKAIKDLENADIMYVVGVQYSYYDNYINEKLYEDDLYSETPEAGKYPESSKAYLMTAMEMIAYVDDVYNGAPFPFTFYEAFSYLYMASMYISMFESTYVQDYAELPILYTKSEDKLPGSMIISSDLGGHDDGVKYLWTSSEVVMDPATPIEGIRVTFIENNGGTTSSGSSYPGIALDEFTLLDDAGNTIAINEVTTNTEYNGAAIFAIDGDINTAYATGNNGEPHMPNGYAYLEFTFAQPVSSFKIKLISNDVKLSPAGFALTHKGVTYDPRLESPNPYNVVVGDKVTSVADLTDGLYAIKGLCNTHPVWGKNEEGKQMGEGDFYTGTSRFHSNPKAIRDAHVFYVKSNADGTKSIMSLANAEYWGTFKQDGYQKGAKSKSDAAKLIIEAAKSEELPGSFVIYEKHDDMTREKVIVTESGMEYHKTSTPYAVYMDWQDGLAARAVVSPQPGVGSEELEVYDDSYGDDYLFNKKNGEGQWEFYKITMDNSDFRYLSALVSLAESLAYAEGTDPGYYTSLGDYPTTFEAAKKCVDEENHSEAAANITALEAALEAVEALEPNRIEVGKEYMLVNGLDAYYTKQGTTKAMYYDTDYYTLSWNNTPEERIENYIFTFEPATYDYDLIELSEEDRANAYLIKCVVTGEYVQSSDTYISVGDFPSTYVTKRVGCGLFNIWSAFDGEWYGLHTEGHSSGAGTAGNIVYWDGNNSAASWWRIMSVETALGIEDLNIENGAVESVTYYTVGGAKVPAPVKGLNVVVTVYTNGAVETKKILVK